MDLEFLTSNNHKYEEMKAKLSGLQINLKHKKISYPEIQAEQIRDVARYSLSLMTPVIKGNFILEDAGLTINSLSGFPGPYSSFAFKSIGNEGILRLMKDVDDRSASFHSVIGLSLNGDSYLFEGICKGKISMEKLGDHGFGFDPIFIPTDYDISFAEMDLEEKNRISHRAISTQKLHEFLNDMI